MLTNDEIIELEQLLELRERDKLIRSLTELDESTSPNYRLLFESVNSQEWGVDETGKLKLLKGVTGCVLEGSSRCFNGEQLVVTFDGYKKIKDLKRGDVVKCYNESTKRVEFKYVNELFKFNNKKKCLRVKLKDGTIIEASEDHKFYFKGAWVSLKDIVSLLNDRKMD